MKFVLNWFSCPIPCNNWSFSVHFEYALLGLFFSVWKGLVVTCKIGKVFFFVVKRIIFFISIRFWLDAFAQNNFYILNMNTRFILWGINRWISLHSSRFSTWFSIWFSTWTSRLSTYKYREYRKIAKVTAWNFILRELILTKFYQQL